MFKLSENNLKNIDSILEKFSDRMVYNSRELSFAMAGVCKCGGSCEGGCTGDCTAGCSGFFTVG